ncbi:MAG: type II secretion system protein M [Magnetococcus sp. DMHC-6]
MKRSFGLNWRPLWQRFSSREQLVLAVGGGVLIAIGIVFLFWLPLIDHIQDRHQQMVERVSTLHWMEESAVEVKRLKVAPVRSGGGNVKRGSLFALADQTARAQSLAGAIKQVEPQGENRVRILLEGASFEKLVAWLVNINQNLGVEVQSLTVEKESSPGLVRARLLLGWMEG